MDHPSAVRILPCTCSLVFKKWSSAVTNGAALIRLAGFDRFCFVLNRVIHGVSSGVLLMAQIARAVAVLVLAGVVSARTGVVYVQVDGSDHTGLGTARSPVATIQKALELLTDRNMPTTVILGPGSSRVTA